MPDDHEMTENTAALRPLDEEMGRRALPEVVVRSTVEHDEAAEPTA